MGKTIPLLLLVLLAVDVDATEPPLVIVACAPGYPGSTEQAQPSMDAFAAGVAAAAGLAQPRVGAVYHERLDAGLARLSAKDAALALVPLPFYLEFRERLRLEPLLEVITPTADDEVWSLVAKRGAVSGPAALAGWEIVGMPGYAPRFVHVALGDWGTLPDRVDIRFGSRVLSDLRRAVKGEPVAVLLDRAQTAALADLPFGGELEVVARSAPVPGSLLCRVGGRASEDEARAVVAALARLHASDGGAELLQTVRIARFRGLRDDALNNVERAFAAIAPRAP